MSDTNHVWKHLERRPGSAYRQLFLKGRRIRASVLYEFYADKNEPMSVEEIAADYALPIEVVAEAIDYCRSNPPELAEDLGRETAYLESQESIDYCDRNGLKRR